MQIVVRPYKLLYPNTLDKLNVGVQHTPKQTGI